MKVFCHIYVKQLWAETRDKTEQTHLKHKHHNLFMNENSSIDICINQHEAYKYLQKNKQM